MFELNSMFKLGWKPGEELPEDTLRAANLARVGGKQASEKENDGANSAMSSAVLQHQLQTLDRFIHDAQEIVHSVNSRSVDTEATVCKSVEEVRAAIGKCLTEEKLDRIMRETIKNHVQMMEESLNEMFRPHIETIGHIVSREEKIHQEAITQKLVSFEERIALFESVMQDTVEANASKSTKQLVSHIFSASETQNDRSDQTKTAIQDSVEELKNEVRQKFSDAETSNGREFVSLTNTISACETATKDLFVAEIGHLIQHIDSRIDEMKSYVDEKMENVQSILNERIEEAVAGLHANIGSNTNSILSAVNEQITRGDNNYESVICAVSDTAEKCREIQSETDKRISEIEQQRSIDSEAQFENLKALIFSAVSDTKAELTFMTQQNTESALHEMKQHIEQIIQSLSEEMRAHLQNRSDEPQYPIRVSIAPAPVAVEPLGEIDTAVAKPEENVPEQVADDETNDPFPDIVTESERTETEPATAPTATPPSRRLRNRKRKN